MRIAAALVLAAAARPAVAQCPDGTPPPCRAARAASAAPPANSVAVLYFESRTRDSSDLYLAEGLTEEIISRLSGIERLTVRSRHMVQRYRGAALADPAAAGRSLNVTYLVTGSLRRVGDRLRLSAELIRADGGAQVWGRQFDQAGDDVLAIQEAVAGEVATGIVGRLLPNEARALAVRPTSSVAAFAAYTRARFHQARRDSAGLLSALHDYETALRAEPAWVNALSGVAMAYGLANGNGISLGMPLDSQAARAMRAATEAVRRAPDNSEAWAALGIARVAADPRRQAGAREALERAVALDPTNAEAHHLLGFHLALFRQDSLGLEHDRIALAIDPSRAVTIQHLVQEAMLHGRLAEARRWLDSILAISPDFGPANAVRLPLLYLEGDTATARRLYQEVSAPGRRPRAASRAGYLAMVPALAGDAAGAMEWLEAAQPRGVFLQYFMRMPAFDRIRNDPRFVRLFAEVSP